jgi:hypothetical protein
MYIPIANGLHTYLCIFSVILYPKEVNVLFYNSEYWDYISLTNRYPRHLLMRLRNLIFVGQLTRERKSFELFYTYTTAADYRT